MTHSIPFRITHIYILASVTGNHLDTARDTENYIKLRQLFEKVEFIEIPSKKVLIKSLAKINEQTNLYDGPLIHIEAHGLDSQDGAALSNGLVLRNGDVVAWEEIREYLTAINTKCLNNLTMVMAACFGLYIVQDLIKTFFEDITGAKCPFFAFVGPVDSINVEEFQDTFRAFYQSLSNKSSLAEAVKEMNLKSNTLFNYGTAYLTFESCVNSYADRQIKNRFKDMQDEPKAGVEYWTSPSERRLR